MREAHLKLILKVSLSYTSWGNPAPLRAFAPANGPAFVNGAVAGITALCGAAFFPGVVFGVNGQADRPVEDDAPENQLFVAEAQGISAFAGEIHRLLTVAGIGPASVL